MGFLTIRATATMIMMAMAIAIIFVTAVKANDKELDKCKDKCNEWKDEELITGNFLCSSNHTAPRVDKMYQKCELDCYGSKPDEDQVKCLCDVCMNLGDKHMAFCEKPGERSPISKEDCEKEVCAGNPKIKFYGFYCDSRIKYENGVFTEHIGED